jgi:molybdopterin-guanine dinucleotide biosynthesis protein A
MSGINNIAGIILAGGRSSRMGGGDKCLLPLGHGTILSAVIDRIRPQVGPLAISANGQPDRFALFGLPVVADTVSGQQGPLAGILAGLEQAEQVEGCEVVLSLAADTPFFPHDLAARLVAAVAGQPERIAVASSGATHPVFALWPVSVTATLRRHLLAGSDRSVKAFLSTRDWIEVPFPAILVAGQPVDPFFNVNRPEDLAQAQSIMKDFEA